SVNLLNGNLTLHIPLISYPQRGDLKLSFELVFNSKNWWPKQIGTKPDGNPVMQWQYKLGPYQAYGVQPVRAPSYTMIHQIINDNPGNPQFGVMTVVSSEGSSHPVGLMADDLVTYESVDSTGLRLGMVAAASGTTWGVTNRSGVTYGMSGCGASGWGVESQDSNGNQIRFTCPSSGPSFLIDSMGRQIQALSNVAWQGTVAGNPTDTTGCPTGSISATLWSLPGYNGGGYPLKFCYASYSLSTNYAYPSVNEGNATANLLVAVIQP